ncbi:MAG: septum formation initiator family protein [Bowdeniella nasicola]|nr:septum formation initiator family protein [Bowdeniella nasicola]
MTSRPNQPRRSSRPRSGASGGRAASSEHNRATSRDENAPPRRLNTVLRAGARNWDAAAKPKQRRTFTWWGKRGERVPASGVQFTTAGGTFSISWRLIFLLIISLLASTVVLTTLQHYVRQAEQVRELNAEVAEVKESIKHYEREKARWANKDFVTAQARDRLGWVVPGEVSYVVVDPQTVTGETRSGDPRYGIPPVAQDPPWYMQVVDSLEITSGYKHEHNTGN